MSEPEISMDPLTEKKIDELPESIMMQQLLINKNKKIMMQHSTKNDIVIDVPSGELPWSKSTSTVQLTTKTLWEMIDVGLQKVSTDHLQDSARRSKSWCIYKVEQNLKKVHEESTFHPKLVSIGPFHHDKSEHLKLMEQHKWRFFSDFLKSMKLTSTGATTSDIFFERCATTSDDTIIMIKKKYFLFAAMENLEAGARACYSETFNDLSSNEFVLMMVLDGCFIIQLLLLFQKSGHSCRNADDPMYTWRSTLPYLRHDLLLLENQLPFTVLQQIFTMSGINKEEYKLTDLILDFFNPVLYRKKMVLDVCKKQLVLSNNIDYCRHNHLLDFFMSSFQTRQALHQEDQQVVQDLSVKLELCSNSPEVIPNDTAGIEFIIMNNFYLPEVIPNGTGHPDQDMSSFQTRKTNHQEDQQVVQEVIPNDTGHGDQDISIHCVTELIEAGVEFKKKDHHDLLDIEFKGGELHIPTLFIDDNTVPVLLNFIAYEQRHHSVKPYFTSYLMFLDYLVNSSKDVEYLHYRGIINHGLGSDEEVATLFNMLCKEVVLDLGDDNYLSQVFTEVNQYFGKRRHRWRAAWKHEYFRTPWAFTSFLAAIVLIVLTFLQSYFAVYAYFYPPPK